MTGFLEFSAMFSASIDTLLKIVRSREEGELDERRD